MYRKTLMAIAIAVVCALGSVGLVACGGSQGSASASASASAGAEASSASSEVDKTAEYQKAIADDAVAQMQAMMKDGFSEIVANDPNWQMLASLGIDVDAFADKFMTVIKIETSSVDVDGDSAVAHLVGTVPDFNSEEASAAMTSALEKVTQEYDPSKMTQEDAYGMVLDAIIESLADPSVPTVTESFDVDYVKSGETWTMKDRDAVAAAITSGMNIGAQQATNSTSSN